ncbi:MAG: SlyX family protein [Paracoccaceae bacterium]|nr:SlyX family protein [Paracoccaceae bacterium]
MSEERLTRLEISNAELTRMVEDLNEVVTRQAGEIETLTRRVEMMMQRLATEEYDSGNTVPLADQKPPHW